MTILAHAAIVEAEQGAVVGRQDIGRQPGCGDVRAVGKVATGAEKLVVRAWAVAGGILQWQGGGQPAEGDVHVVAIARDEALAVFRVERIDRGRIVVCGMTAGAPIAQPQAIVRIGIVRHVARLVRVLASNLVGGHQNVTGRICLLCIGRVQTLLEQAIIPAAVRVMATGASERHGDVLSAARIGGPGVRADAPLRCAGPTQAGLVVVATGAVVGTDPVHAASPRVLPRAVHAMRRGYRRALIVYESARQQVAAADALVHTVGDIGIRARRGAAVTGETQVGNGIDQKFFCRGGMGAVASGAGIRSSGISAVRAAVGAGRYRLDDEQDERDAGHKHGLDE